MRTYRTRHRGCRSVQAATQAEPSYEPIDIFTGVNEDYAPTLRDLLGAASLLPPGDGSRSIDLPAGRYYVSNTVGVQQGVINSSNVSYNGGTLYSVSDGTGVISGTTTSLTHTGKTFGPEYVGATLSYSSGAGHFTVTVTSVTGGNTLHWLGAHAAPNSLTDYSVYANYSGITLNGHVDGTILTGGVIVPLEAIHDLHPADPLYNKFSSGARASIKMIDLTQIGIAAGHTLGNTTGAFYTSQVDGQYNLPPPEWNLPLVPHEDGIPLSFCASRFGKDAWNIPSAVSNSVDHLTQIISCADEDFEVPAVPVDARIAMAMADWTYKYGTIASVSSGAMTLATPLSYNNTVDIATSMRFKIENAPNYLLTAGQYYLSFSTNRLYFIPTAAGEISLALNNSNLLQAYSHDPAKEGIGEEADITVSGITFSEVKRKALYGNGANIIVDLCTFCSTGMMSIYLTRLDSPSVTNSYFIHLQGAALRIDDDRFDEDSYAAFVNDVGNTVVNPGYIWSGSGHFAALGQGALTEARQCIPIVSSCVFNDCGSVYPDVETASFFNTTGATVSDNQFNDCANCGVRIHGVNNQVLSNKFVGVCKSVGDMGGVYAGLSYLCGSDTFQYNAFRDITLVQNGVTAPCGIYLDDGGSGELCVRNVFRACDVGFRVNGGRWNTFDRNFFRDVDEPLAPNVLTPGGWRTASSTTDTWGAQLRNLHIMIRDNGFTYVGTNSDVQNDLFAFEVAWDSYGSDPIDTGGGHASRDQARACLVACGIVYDPVGSIPTGNQAYDAIPNSVFTHRSALDYYSGQAVTTSKVGVAAVSTSSDSSAAQAEPDWTISSTPPSPVKTD